MEIISNKANDGKRTPGQEVLLHAFAIHQNDDIGKLIDQASVGDLEWFVLMLELHLEEVPHHISDEGQLKVTQDWARLIRSTAIGALHNKRVAANKRARVRGLVKDVLLVIFGSVLGTILTLWFTGGATPGQ